MVRVRDIMTKSVITLGHERSIDDAKIMMQRHQIHHLPVLDAGGTVVGIVSEKDFAKIPGHHYQGISGNSVTSVMSGDVITCTPSCRVASVAATMITCKIACVPVVSIQTLVGIVTTSDLLDLLCRFDEFDGHQVMPLNYRNRDAFFF